MANSQLNSLIVDVVQLMLSSVDVRLLSNNTQIEEQCYKDFGVSVTIKRSLGFPNTLTVSFVHKNYTIIYKKTWPVIEDEKLNLHGLVTTNTLGDCSLFVELATFMKLRQ